MGLTRKQSSSNKDWIEAVATIEQAVPRAVLDELVKNTVSEIRQTAGNREATYAWSGGKDSIVLGKLCEMAGIVNSMIGVCNLEYPAFMSWIQDHKPAGCEIINTGHDLNWLKEHPNMLFPQDSSTAAHWFSIVQHRAQMKYFKAHNLDVLILGRRRADGNYVGSKTNIYTNAQGVTRYSPLADWTHEQILAFLHYYGMEMPPIYGWPNGYVCGTHPWPARPGTGSEENGWREIFGIDKSIVVAAADAFPLAKKCLEVMGE